MDINKTEKVAFAGGCFWCMEADFEKLNGVVEVISGYTGGNGENPTYENYAQSGHIEAVEIIYEPVKVNFEELLKVFWSNIDPTDGGGQFVDRGRQYRSAIFYHSEGQRKLAEKSKESLEESGKFKKPIVTEIIKAGFFYKAEEYHQDYYRKRPVRYKIYRFNSGRDQFLKKMRGDDFEIKNGDANSKKYRKPSNTELKKKLTPLQYKVTQQNATERPFDNEYWNKKEVGIYVDIVSGEPLFSSVDKFDSGTGWPSFSTPLEPENIVEKEDRSLFTTRTEVRSKYADSHLGHLFDDGPLPARRRYCINSAALRFISKEDLEKEGYEKYKSIFEILSNEK